MGYTHYWYRNVTIEQEAFDRILADFRKLLPFFRDYGVLLGDRFGENEPELTHHLIAFNGLQACGHPEKSHIMIPWPALGAGGVAMPGEDVDVGDWSFGTELIKRDCNGDCSYESFVFPRILKVEDWFTPNEDGQYFQFCKTAFRPYDIAVTAFLVIAKHVLQDDIYVSSDGLEEHWFDGKLICQMHLGYGLDVLIRT